MTALNLTGTITIVFRESFVTIAAAMNVIDTFSITVEPRFNEPLHNEVLGITNDIFQPSNNVMYGKEPRYNEPSI